MIASPNRCCTRAVCGDIAKQVFSPVRIPHHHLQVVLIVKQRSQGHLGWAVAVAVAVWALKSIPVVRLQVTAPLR